MSTDNLPASSWIRGSGTYGEVYLGYKKDDVKTLRVALKKMLMKKSDDGIGFTTIREMKVMQECRHAHILEDQNLYLALEFMSSDLETVIEELAPLPLPHMKSYMKMALDGLCFMHENYLLHRDVKPSNMLINDEGILKLADFGLTCPYGSPAHRLTPRVCTQYYRAPELLYGADQYGPAIDIWALGCVMAEMMTKTPLFRGNNSDIDQLRAIYKILGTPSTSSWPGLEHLRDYVFKLEPMEGVGLRAAIPPVSDDTLDFLSSMLSLDPNKRPTARQLLSHRWFDTQPTATPPSLLPKALRENQRKRQGEASPALRATAGAAVKRLIFDDDEQ